MSEKNKKAIVSGAGWIGTFSGLLIEELEILGISFEDIHKLGKLTSDGRKLVKICANAIAGEVRGVKINWSQNKFLRLISNINDPPIIDSVDVSELIIDATDVFRYIDSDLKSWGVDEKGISTGQTPTVVTEMVNNDGTFVHLFGSLFGAAPAEKISDTEIAEFIKRYSTKLDKLCLSQSQIKGFVKKHRNWLRQEGYATFFLLKSHGNFFVVRVGVDSDGLCVCVRRLEYSGVWYAEYRHRLVAPQSGLGL